MSNLILDQNLNGFVADFNNAAPGSVERIKAFLAISHCNVTAENAAIFAEVLMQIRFDNNQVDDEIIMGGLNADSDTSAELINLYGENPWNATNSLLSSPVREIVKEKAQKDYGFSWHASFMQYES